MKFKACPECGSPMTNIFDPADNFPYWKCDWCNCECEYLRGRIVKQGSAERVAECQKDGDKSALAAAYRRGFSDGCKSTERMK